MKPTFAESANAVIEYPRDPAVAETGAKETARPGVSSEAENQIVLHTENAGLSIHASEDDDDSESCTCSNTSIAGDSLASSGVDSAAELERVQPRRKSVAERIPGRSSKWNNEKEVGNMGIFFGNWGLRGTTNDAQKIMRRIVHDRQVQKNPGVVVILCEATPEVERVLEERAQEGIAADKKCLDARCTAEHHVVRGNEQQAAVLIARTTPTVVVV